MTRQTGATETAQGTPGEIFGRGPGRRRSRPKPAAGWLRCALAALWPLMVQCGYVGDPQPPALKIPAPVKDLTAVERGDRIVISFTVTGETTEGLRLKRYGEADLRLGAEGVRPFEQSRWETSARRIPVPLPAEPGRVRVETPAAEWAGREVIVGVRLANPHGRWSAWSNLAALQVVEPLAAPTNLRARAVPEGVKLEWSLPARRPGVRFRVQRKTGDSEGFAAVGETAVEEWIDTGTQYGVRYEYRVQTILPAGAGAAESEWSAPVTITPEDRFPPAPPTGLTAAAGVGSIELVWEASGASDLAGYKVYRSDGGPEKPVSGLLALPAYSDRDVVSGTRYRYRVTAVDKKGNESAPSAPAEVAAP